MPLNSCLKDFDCQDVSCLVLVLDHWEACYCRASRRRYHLLRNLCSNSREGGNHGSDVAGEPVLLPLTYPRCRGEYIVPGPDYIWSIDRYCKLEYWGIEIYAAIDAYSRYIVWVYIGVTNRTGISVLRQYLDPVECEAVPVVLRSDKGSETTMVAAAHHKIRQPWYSIYELLSIWNQSF